MFIFLLLGLVCTNIPVSGFTVTSTFDERCTIFSGSFKAKQPECECDSECDSECKPDATVVAEEDNIHSVNNHTESLPHPQPEALPELDERDKVIQAWNAQTVTQNIEAINPLSKREQDTRLCINGNLDKYLQTINDLDNQSFFLDQSKRGNLLKYDWFCNPNNYQKVVEGNYKDGYSREPPRKEAVHEESYDE